MSSENTLPLKTPNALESQHLPTDVAESPQGVKASQDAPNDSGTVPDDKAESRFFGIPAYQASQPNRPANRFNYEQKYAPDAEGEEIDDNARVWHVYVDEMEQYDNDMLKGFRDTIDTLLIFAGLFSAIVTAFLVESIQKLEPDQAEITNQLLVEVAGLLRAGGNSSEIKSTSSAQYSPDTTDVWVNGLFLTSLSLSLSTALFSVLIKQWLLAYSSLPSGSPQYRARTRQFRFTGLEEWKVRQIIGLLPLVIHAALAIFIMGLATLIFVLRPSLSSIVIIISGLTFLLYLTSLFLPVFWPRCPYRVPELYIPAQYLMMPFKYFLAKYSPRRHRYRVRPIIAAEFVFMDKNTTSTALMWLFEQSFNRSVQKIAAIAMGTFLGPLGRSNMLSSILRVESSRDIFFKMSAYAMRKLGEQKSHSGSYTFQRKGWMETFTLYLGRDLNKRLWDVAISTDFPPALWRLPIVNIDSTPYLRQAIAVESWNVAEFLLERGADPTIMFGYNTINRALFDDGALHAIKLACKKCTNPNIQDDKGRTPLHEACLVPHREIIEALLRNGADPNILNKWKQSALHIALEMPNPNQDSIELLLNNGAKVNQQDPEGSTPLHNACCTGNSNPGVVDFLLSHGANPNIQNSVGKLPIDVIRATDSDDTDEVRRLLISHGAQHPPSVPYVRPHYPIVLDIQLPSWASHIMSRKRSRT